MNYDDDEKGGLTPTQRQLQAIGKRNYKRDGELPVIERDSEPWRAWRRWYLDADKRHESLVAVMDRQERWTVVSVWPPVNVDQLAIEAKNDKGGLSGKARDRLKR